MKGMVGKVGTEREEGRCKISGVSKSDENGGGGVGGR